MSEGAYWAVHRAGPGSSVTAGTAAGLCTLASAAAASAALACASLRLAAGWLLCRIPNLATRITITSWTPFSNNNCHLAAAVLQDP